MEVINLNLIPSGANPVAHAAQFDVGRVTRFNLLEGATPYTLDGTETITASVRKNDGHIVTEAVTNTSDSYLEVITTEQMTACAGENLATIKIKKGSDTIATLNYILMVQKDPEDGGDPSESFIHDLSQQIADAVSEQYAAEDVIFDNTPTAGHGTGYTVTSEGILAAIPDEISDLSDVSITSPQAGEILIWNGAEWENQANPASTANFAPDYDSAATYDKNEKVIYQGLLYIANDDGITGAWDPTKWDPFTVGDLTAETLPLGANDPTTTSEAIGDLSQLTTTDKSSLVGAVKEVVSTKTNVFKDKIVIGSVTAGTKYDLFTLSHFTGGLVADFSALKGLMYLGGGGNSNSYGYLFCNPITNIISYIPQVSDTNVSIYIAVLY